MPTWFSYRSSSPTVLYTFFPLVLRTSKVIRFFQFSYATYCFHIMQSQLAFSSFSCSTFWTPSHYVPDTLEDFLTVRLKVLRNVETLIGNTLNSGSVFQRVQHFLRSILYHLRYYFTALQRGTFYYHPNIIRKTMYFL